MHGIYDVSRVSQLIPHSRTRSAQEGDACHLWHVTKDGQYVCVADGDHLDIIHTKDGRLRAVWYYRQHLTAASKVTAVEDIRHGTATKLIVGLWVDEYGLVCVFDLSLSRVTRAVRLPHKVQCVEVVSTQRDSAINSMLVEQLQSFSGIVAVGTAQAHVYIIDMCLDDAPVATNEQCPRHLEIVTPRTRDIAEARRDAVTHGHHLCMHLDEESHLDGYAYRKPGCDIMETFDKSSVSVTALRYIAQTGTLAVGFNFGCYQLWKLSCPVLEFSSSYEDVNPPITHFTHQEPENDPRNFSYLWVTHSPTANDSQDNTVSSVVLYQLSYKKKLFYATYGTYFEDLLMVGCRFEMFLTSNIYAPNTACRASRVLACHTVHDPQYTAPSALRVDESFEESIHGPDLSLCMMVWAVETTHSSQYYLGLFDINRWYHSQMPVGLKQLGSPDEQCPYMAVYCLDRILQQSPQTSLMAVHIGWRSVQKYINRNIPITPEQHFYPTSLKFDALCVLESGLVSVRCLGLQRQALSDLEQAGPRALVDPSHMYHLCVTRGLIPRAVHSPGFYPSQVEERGELLSLCLDNDRVSYIKACIAQWATDPEYVNQGCTLKFLLEWAWNKLGQAKESVNKTTACLFDWSGCQLDDRSNRTLHAASHRLEMLIHVFRAFLTQAAPITEEGCGELVSRLEVCQLISQHATVLMWFLQQGLLPEREDLDDSPGPGYCYPLTDLVGLYKARRDHLNTLNRNVGAGDLLMIDGLLHEMGAGVADRLMYGGGDGSYPPPSLHEALNLYLIDGVPLESKHCVLLYLLLDLHSLHDPDDPKQRALMERLSSFPRVTGLARNVTVQATAFWQLDHQQFEAAVNGLTGADVTHVLGAWQHERIIKSLLYQGHHKLALQYIRARRPGLATAQQVKLHLTVLLANGLTSEALNYQRSCNDDLVQLDLMTHIIEGCQQMKTFKNLLEQPLTPVEDAILCNYLRNHDDVSCRQLLVTHYLLRCRYVDAIRLNDEIKMHPAMKRGQSKNSIQSAQNLIVDKYRSLLPATQRALISYPGAVKLPNSVVIKTVPKPQPLSTVVVRGHSNKLSSRSDLIATVMDKIRECVVSDLGQMDVTTQSTSRFVFTDLDPALVQATATPNSSFHLTPALHATNRRLTRTLTDDALSMLKTPPVVRRSRGKGVCHTPQLPTPHSILKVRTLIRRTPSPTRQLESLSDTALTPPLQQAKLPAHLTMSPPGTPKQLRFADSVVTTSPHTPPVSGSLGTQQGPERLQQDISDTDPSGNKQYSPTGDFRQEERLVLHMVSSSEDEEVFIDSPRPTRLSSPTNRPMDEGACMDTSGVFLTPPELPHPTLVSDIDLQPGPREALFSHKLSPVSVQEADSSCDARFNRSTDVVDADAMQIGNESRVDVNASNNHGERNNQEENSRDIPSLQDNIEAGSDVIEGLSVGYSELTNIQQFAFKDIDVRNVREKSEIEDEGGIVMEDIDYTPRERRSIHDSFSPPSRGSSQERVRKSSSSSSKSGTCSPGNANPSLGDPSRVGSTVEIQDKRESGGTLLPESPVPRGLGHSTSYRSPATTTRALRPRLAKSVDREMIQQSPSSSPVRRSAKSKSVDREMIQQSPSSSPVRRSAKSKSVDREMIPQSPSSYPLRRSAKSKSVDKEMIQQSPSSSPVRRSVKSKSVDRGMIQQSPSSSPVRKSAKSKSVDRGMIQQSPSSSPAGLSVRSTRSVEPNIHEELIQTPRRRGRPKRSSIVGLPEHTSNVEPHQEKDLIAERNGHDIKWSQTQNMSRGLGDPDSYSQIPSRSTRASSVEKSLVYSSEQNTIGQSSSETVNQSAFRRSTRASSVEKSLVYSSEQNTIGQSSSETVNQSALRRSTRASSVEKSLVYSSEQNTIGQSSSETVNQSAFRRSTRASSVEKSLVYSSEQNTIGQSSSETVNQSALRRSTRASSVEKSLVYSSEQNTIGQSSSETVNQSALRRSTRASSVEKSLVYSSEQNTIGQSSIETVNQSPLRRSTRASSVEKSLVYTSSERKPRQNTRAKSVEPIGIQTSPEVPHGRWRRAISVETETQTTPGLTKLISRTQHVCSLIKELSNEVTDESHRNLKTTRVPLEETSSVNTASALDENQGRHSKSIENLAESFIEGSPQGSVSQSVTPTSSRGARKAGGQTKVTPRRSVRKAKDKNMTLEPLPEHEIVSEHAVADALWEELNQPEADTSVSATRTSRRLRGNTPSEDETSMEQNRRRLTVSHIEGAAISRNTSVPRGRRMTIDNATLANTPRSPPMGAPPAKRGRSKVASTPASPESDIELALLSPFVDPHPTPRVPVRRRRSIQTKTMRTRTKKFGSILSHRI